MIQTQRYLSLNPHINIFQTAASADLSQHPGGGGETVFFSTTTTAATATAPSAAVPGSGRAGPRP